MTDFREEFYKGFDMFDRQWALVTAGNIEDFDGCTVGWGSIGNIWKDGNRTCPIITVYVHPARYTSEYLIKNDTFTVSFYPESCRKALGYMGSHSGRNEDKAENAGLTPVSVKDTVTFKEAEKTYVCKKLYQHQFDRESLDPMIQEYYASNPKAFPDAEKRWQPHYMFIGEVTEVIKNDESEGDK